MEQKTKDGYCTIISLKLHNILAENGIEAETTEINNSDPTKIVWKYKPSTQLYELLTKYVNNSHSIKKNNTSQN